jgi:hypothetical protein
VFAKVVARWVVIAIAVPLAAAGAHRLSRALESRRGSSRVSRLLSKGATALQSISGGRRRRFR